MADTFQLQVATPERLLVDEQVHEAELPGKEGYMGVLPGHAPLLSALGAGVLSYDGGSGGRNVFVVDGGFVEIFEDHVRVLADAALPADEVQIDTARRDLEQAKEALKNAQDEAASEAAMDAAARAQARIDAAERSGSSRG